LIITIDVRLNDLVFLFQKKMKFDVLVKWNIVIWILCMSSEEFNGC
jgi:hypothetical protein